jgi:hypothetical protein
LPAFDTSFSTKPGAFVPKGNIVDAVKTMMSLLLKIQSLFQIIKAFTFYARNEE